MALYEMINSKRVKMSPEREAAFLAQQEVDASVVRGPRLPHLEPDQFWFVVRVSGSPQPLFDWLADLNDPDSPEYDPVEWAYASAKLEYAKHFERDHPLVEVARLALGLTVEELDALWVYAGA
jgi:hypothetical protein